MRRASKCGRRPNGTVYRSSRHVQDIGQQLNCFPRYEEEDFFRWRRDLRKPAL